MKLTMKKLWKTMTGILLVASLTMSLASCTLWEKESESESGQGGLISDATERETETDKDTRCREDKSDIPFVCKGQYLAFCIHLYENVFKQTRYRKRDQKYRGGAEDENEL